MMRLFHGKKREGANITISAPATLMSQACSFTIDSKGNTPLHLAAMSIQYEETLKTLFDTYSESDIALMATTINLNNKLPFDLVNTPKNLAQVELKKTLRDYTIRLTATPMNEPLSIDEILNNYYQAGNTTLTMHLNIACDLANEVRSIIIESSNHPAQTFGKNAERSHDKILFMRSLYTPEFPSTDPYTPANHTLNDVLAMGSLIELLKHGNCHEASTLALKKLHENKKYPLTGELAYVTNSDHVVTVIGRDQNSDPTDYSNWGDTAVICDAWLGRVYPATSIPTELKGSKRYNFASSNIGYTVIINFNPDYHELKLTSDPIQSSFKPKTQSILRLFHVAHPKHVFHSATSKSDNKHTMSRL